MVHTTRPRPFQGQFVIRGLALTTIKLSKKLVSNSTHYTKRRKAMQNIDNGWYEVVMVTQCH